MSRFAPLAAALALLALTAGCGSDEPPPAAAEAEASTAEVAAPAGDVDPPMLVDAQGLRLLDHSGGGERRFAFGSDWADLRRALAFRGEPDEAGTNRECGAGPLEYATWSDGLTLYAQAGEFAGWALDGQSAGIGAAGGISTAAGIGPGRTRADLDKAYSPAVTQTTLGTEFTGDGLSGVLEGPGEDAKIIAMWAGVSCNFR